MTRVHRWRCGATVASLALAIVCVLAPVGRPSACIFALGSRTRQAGASISPPLSFRGQPRDGTTWAGAGGAPRGIGVDVDCRLRWLAWNYSRTLLPQRGQLPAVFDALRLGSQCNMTPPAREMARNPPAWTQVPRHAKERRQANPPVLTVYVDAARGNDGNNGSLTSPLRTIHAAVRMTRGPARSVGSAAEVVLRGGTYYVGSTVALGTEDSFLTIRAYTGEEAVVSGGHVLGPLTWKPVKQGFAAPRTGWSAIQNRGLSVGGSVPGITYAGVTNTSDACAALCKGLQGGSACTGYTWWDPAVPASGANASRCYVLTDGSWDLVPAAGAVSGQFFNVWAADVSQLGGGTFTQMFIDSGSIRAIRARHPNGNPETSGLYSNPTGYMAHGNYTPSGEVVPDPVEIQLSTPSRNMSAFPTFGVGEGGSVSQFVPPMSIWGQVTPPHGHWCVTVPRCQLPRPHEQWHDRRTARCYCCRYHVPHGLSFNETVFPAQPWTHVERAVVHAFQGEHWGNWQYQVAGLEQDNPRPGFVNISWVYGGFQEARGDTIGAEYYIENLLELLDSPLEWCVAGRVAVATRDRSHTRAFGFVYQVPGRRCQQRCGDALFLPQRQHTPATVGGGSSDGGGCSCARVVPVRSGRERHP